MNAKSNEIVKPDKNKNINQTIDKSRRSFAKAGIVAPVIMTLTSKTVLGESPYHCTVSGMHSGNQSSRIGGGDNCHTGFSPGAWKTPGNSGDGSLDQWLAAGCSPFTINVLHPNCVSGIFKENTALSELCGTNKVFGALKAKDAYTKILNSNHINATTFSDKFGGGDNRSFHEILMTEEGSLKFHAIADYLNAALSPKPSSFGSIYDNISPSYIVDVYNSSLTDKQKKDYFILIHH
ncbi:MAG: hypothetical protein Q7U66_08480 [Methylobacter sp.]|nr:hypothetical protein [Methylobacter sp.]